MAHSGVCAVNSKVHYVHDEQHHWKSTTQQLIFERSTFGFRPQTKSWIPFVQDNKQHQQESSAQLRFYLNGYMLGFCPQIQNIKTALRA